MTESEKSLFKHIGSVKNSLESAEQSFKDKKDVRGALDLMLAEAELKNLRRKKDAFWTWNRHMLAICVAGMIALGGIVGWFFATDKNQNAKGLHSDDVPKVVRDKNPKESDALLPDTKESAIDKKYESAKSSNEEKQNVSQVNITKNDMHRLVRSARKELSNSN